METNMDDFNEATALILDRLYQQFPQELILDVRELGVDVSDENRFENFRSSVVFLDREGFIRFHSEAGGGAGVFSFAVLTSKGLEVLNSVPDSLKGEKPLGEQIRKAVKEGSKEMMKTLIQQTISVGVRTLLC